MVSANQRAIEAARSRLILNQRAQQQLAARRPPVLRRPVARGDGLDRLRAAARASAPQQQGRTDPKPGGLLGGILSNPVARAVLKPLEALDTPRRFVISGINEIADGFNGGDASWREFVDQASDPSFGFGDVVGETGNKWLDRAIGFAGDVAFDPLTYLTLGAGKLAGAGGRSAAAAQLASKGAGEEVVQRAGRLGVNALSGAERGLIGLDRAGMRFMGRRIGGQGDNVVSRVNEAVGSGIGTGLAQARAAVRSTGPGSAVARRLTRPAELTDEFEKLATGRGELSAIDAANNIASDAAEKATAGRFHAAHATPIDVIARKHRGDDRINLAHNIESGVAGEYEDLARQTLRTVREDLNQTGIQLGDLGGNYLPHRETKEGAEWLGRVQPDFAKSNLTGAVRAQKERQWKVGETVTIDGKSAVITDDTIKGLNDFFKREFGAPAKVYEDDFVKLMDRYMNEVSTAAGRQARVSRLVEGGSAVELPNTLNEPLAPDVARSVAASAPDQLRAQLDRKATNTARRGVMDEARGLADSATSEAMRLTGKATSQLGKVQRRAQRLAGDVERGDVAVEAVGQPVAALRRAADVRLNTGRYKRPSRVRAALNEEADDIARFLDDANLDPSDPVVAETRELVSEAAARIAASEEAFDRAAKSRNFVKEVKADPMYAAMMRVELRNGWERIGEELLQGGDAVAVRSELAARLKRVDNAIQSGDFWKPIEAYTRFFKSYATMTPGFHVRNGMSATFMNFADDVAAKNQIDGWKWWVQYERGGPDTFLDRIPAKDRPLLDDALQAVYGSGGGRGQFSVEELGSRGNRLVDNPATRFSKRTGGYVEGGARLGMALDTLRKGGTVEDAIARITRIHFNYSDVGSIDRAMRRFIPFWTFMSRNLPLQVQQMWLKPRTYAHYNSLVRNLRDEEGEADDIIPLSWRRMGGFKLPEIGGQDNVYLAPDLPMNRLFEQVEDFGSTRMLASANPLFRMPLEFMQGEQFFSGRRFEDDQFEKMDGELTPFGPLAAALTPWAENTDEGVVADERLTYAMRNLMPLLGQMQRIAPTDEYYDDRDVSSRLGYAGIPVKTLTARQQESEARRRRFEGQRADPNIARQEALRRFLAEN